VTTTSTPTIRDIESERLFTGIDEQRISHPGVPSASAFTSACGCRIDHTAKHVAKCDRHAGSNTDVPFGYTRSAA